MTDSEAQNKRDAIMDAALAVFAEVGYERATIKAIAARAGVKSPALLYWYFPNKAAILHGVMVRYMPIVGETVDQTLFVNLPADQLLRLVGSNLLTAYQTNPQLGLSFRIILSELLHQTGGNTEVMQAGPLLLLNLLRQNLRANIERGLLREHNVEVSARMILGSLFIYILGAQVITVMGEGAPTAEAYVDAVVTHLLDGLRAAKD